MPHLWKEGASALYGIPEECMEEVVAAVPAWLLLTSNRDRWSVRVELLMCGASLEKSCSTPDFAHGL